MAEEDDLLREHQAADRSIEGRGDAGAGAGCDQHLGAIGRQLTQLRDGRADRAANLRNRAFAADRCARAQRQRGAGRLDEDPAPFDLGRAEIDHLEKIRKAVTEHVAGKNSVEQQDGDAAAHQDHGDQRAIPSAVVDAERVPLEPAKQPREKFDQAAKAEIAERREHSHGHCEQNQLDVFELVAAQRKRRSSHANRRCRYTPRNRCATARNSSRRS